MEKVLESGSSFGELALLYNEKRSATIEALEQCTTYVLDGSLFKGIVIKSNIEKRTIKVGFLDQIKVLDSLDRFQKLKLIEGLR